MIRRSGDARLRTPLHLVRRAFRVGEIRAASAEILPTGIQAIKSETGKLHSCLHGHAGHGQSAGAQDRQPSLNDITHENPR
jgi:hypothetical protein